MNTEPEKIVLIQVCEEELGKKIDWDESMNGVTLTKLMQIDYYTENTCKYT